MTVFLLLHLDRITSLGRYSDKSVVMLLSSLMAVVAPLVATNSGCKIQIPATANTCWTWDLAAVSSHSWSVNTSTCPKDCNLYLVANPCGPVRDFTACAAAPTPGSSPAYQVQNNDHSCMPLGRTSQVRHSDQNITLALIVRTRN